MNLADQYGIISVLNRNVSLKSKLLFYEIKARKYYKVKTVISDIDEYSYYLKHVIFKISPYLPDLFILQHETLS